MEPIRSPFSDQTIQNSKFKIQNLQLFTSRLSNCLIKGQASPLKEKNMIPYSSLFLQEEVIILNFELDYFEFVAKRR